MDIGSDDIGLDFETYSDVDIKEHGFPRYIADPSFTVLCASIDDKDGRRTYDFILDPDGRENFLLEIVRLLFSEDSANNLIVAHNAGFERGVMRKLGFPIDERIVDSAVYARMAGAGEKLEVASRQLTNTPKLAVGMDLIKLFCVPNEHNKDKAPTPEMILRFTEQWLAFLDYCEVDAAGSREIRAYALELFGEELIAREDELELITYHQNQAGWHIDRPLIKQMANRAWANSYIEQQSFLLDTGKVLNFNSHQQIKRYCADRGFPIKSTDKYQLPIALEKAKIELAELSLKATDEATETRARELSEVIRMLECKHELGGSSLSKLNKILDLANDDDQLRDQYIHCGAGQTFRTSGRGVQMQNLKKLIDQDGKESIRDMETVYDFAVDWSNTDMASQLRQVFTASHEDGQIIVGDFSAVESRALAYEAGEEWKLQAYRDGQDVYKVLVTRFSGFEGRTVDSITTAERPRGKYSELSCGYQASAKAVKDFMFRLGFVVPLDEAAQNVVDWRGANPFITDMWWRLDQMLKDAVRYNGVEFTQLAYGMRVVATPFLLPSIQEIHPGAVSLKIELLEANGNPIVTRIIHGCYMHGRSIVYYKPAERVSDGPLWTNINATASQKAKKTILLSVYGGKLAGILTQSLCRELFYDSMAEYQRLLEENNVQNAVMVGQFHDEIATDWWPMKGGHTLEEVKALKAQAMSTCRLPGFPLIADIKSAYRYIK